MTSFVLSQLTPLPPSSRPDLLKRSVRFLQSEAPLGVSVTLSCHCTSLNVKFTGDRRDTPYLPLS